MLPTGLFPGGNRGPLLVLECLSPSTEAKDREDNPIIYGLMGVAEYWICSPE